MVDTDRGSNRSSDRMSDKLKKIGEDLADRKKRLADENERLNQKIERLNDLKNNAGGVLSEYDQKVKDFERRLGPKDDIHKVIEQINILKSSINNQDPKAVETADKSIYNIDRSIQNFRNFYRRIKVIDAVRNTAAMWIGGLSIAAASVFGGYEIYRPMNTEDVPSSNSSTEYVKNFSDVLKRGIPSLESITKLEGVFSRSEAEKNAVIAMLDNRDARRTELFQRVKTPEYDINNEQDLVAMIEQLRARYIQLNTSLEEANRVIGDQNSYPARIAALETKNKEYKDANALWKSSRDTMYTKVGTLTGQNITTDAGMLSIIEARIKEAKDIYSYINNSNLGHVSNVGEVQHILENLASTTASLEAGRMAVYSALTPMGVTPASTPQEVQTAVQAYINKRNSSERKLQGAIDTIGGEKTGLENKLQAVYTALTSIGVTPTSTPQDVQTKIQTLISDKASLEQRITQMSGTTWEIEYREYLENPQDHTFQSIEVLKKHSERTGVVAILEDKIQLSDELKTKLGTDYGWNNNDPNRPVELYVQNGDFEFLGKDGFYINNVKKVAYTDTGNDPDARTGSWIRRDKNNIYLCGLRESKQYETFVVFGKPESDGTRIKQFSAEFVGTGSDNKKSVLGNEDEGPSVYIIDGPTPENIKELPCTGLWAPWKEKVLDSPNGQGFYPFLNLTETIFFTTEKRGPAIGIDLRYDSNIASLDLDPVRRFNDAWMSMSVGARGRYTDIWETKDNSSLPASIKTIKGETSKKSSDMLDMTYATVDVVSFTMFPTRIISPYVSIGVPLAQTRMNVGSNHITPEQYMNERDIQAFPLSGGLKIGGSKGEVFPYGHFYWGLDYHLESLSKVVVRDSKGVQVASGDGLVHGLGFELGFLVDDGLHPEHPQNTGRFRLYLGGGWNLGRLNFEDGTNKRTSTSILTPVDSSLGKIDIQGTYGTVGIDFEF